MNKKHLYKIINESISEFDFLGLDHSKKESNRRKVYASREFKTGIIKEFLRDNSEKLSDPNGYFNSYEVDNSETDNAEHFELNYDLVYDMQDINFPFTIHMEGKKDTPEESDIIFYDDEGEEIDMKWTSKNPELKTKIVNSLFKRFKI